MSIGLPSSRAWYRIGEIARWLGVDQSVVRYWESEFRSFLGKTERSRGGQRVYSRRNAVALGVVKHLLRVELYTIEGAKRQLRLAAKREKTEATVE